MSSHNKQLITANLTSLCNSKLNQFFSPEGYAALLACSFTSLLRSLHCYYTFFAVLLVLGLGNEPWWCIMNPERNRSTVSVSMFDTKETFLFPSKIPAFCYRWKQIQPTCSDKLISVMYNEEIWEVSDNWKQCPSSKRSFKKVPVGTDRI